MKYISDLYPHQDLDFIKQIFESNIEINYLNVDFSNGLKINPSKYKNFDDLLEEYKFITDSNSDKIKNLDKIKIDLNREMSNIARQFAIDSGVLDETSRSYILKNIYSTLEYALHLGSPFPGSNEFMLFNFFDEEKNAYDKNLVLTYLRKIYLPYVKKAFPKDYPEKIKELIDIIVALININSHECFNILFDIYDNDLPKEIIDKIFIKKKIDPIAIYSYFKKLNQFFESKKYNEKQIINSFIKNDGEYHYAYKKILLLKYHETPVSFSSIFHVPAPPEMEDSLFSNVSSMLRYLSYPTFPKNYNIDRFLIHLEKYPERILNWFLNTSFSSFYDTRVEIKRIPIKSDPTLALKFYNKLVFDWSSITEEDDNRIFLRKDIEESISKSSITSIGYLMKIVSSLKKKMKMKEIRKYIDDNLSKIKKSILESDDSMILLDYANSLKLKLSDDLEKIIQRVPKFWNDYQKIKFIK